MADGNIAGKWMKANGLRWDPKKSQKKRKRHRAPKAVSAPVFYHPLDRVAHEDKIRNERTPRSRAYGPKLPGPHPNYALRGLRFLEVNLSFSEPQCLLMPGVAAYQGCPVTFQGQSMAAYRAMCLMAHGRPPAPDAGVARHLCGNGHLNCVNPTHLEWGTQFENQQDRRLHWSRPAYMPDVTPEARAQIEASRELPNILAIRHQIPSAIIDLIQRGLA